MIVLDRNVPPPQERLVFLGDDPADELLEAVTLAVVRWQEHRPRRKLPRRRQRDPDPGGFPPQEAVRHLDHDAGAVAGIRLAAARAAVLQVDEDLEAARDHLVRSPARYVDNETHT